MKKVSVFLIANLVAVNFAFSQNGMSINPTGATADSSAILDVNTTNQEILIPRLTGSGWYMLECSVPSITGQPVAQTICEGNNTSFSITATGAGLTYQWQLSTDGGSTWTNQANGGVYSNMTTATMNITNASAGMNTYQYHCVVNGTCALAAISDAATLTVNPLPNITATPSLQTICSSATTDITLTSDVTGTTFAWTLAQSGVAGATDGSGNSIAQTLTNSGISTGTATYSITPTANTCSGTSTDVVITVNPTPNVTATPSSQAICSGSATGITLTSNVTGTTFAWTVAQSGVAGASDGSGSSIAQTLTNTGTSAGTATYTITPTANSCSGTSTDVVVTVNPTPVMSSTLTPTAICSGTIFNYTAASAASGATFAWSRATISGITEAGTTGTGDVSEVLTNTTFVSINVTYVYTITANGCPPNTQNVVVMVNPIPNVTLPSLQTICNNTATNITLTSNVSGATFAWTVAQSGVTGATDGSGSSIAQTLTNSGTTAGTATYTITPSYTNGGVTCVGTSPPHVVITVKPLPNVIATPSSQTICNGSVTGITLTSNVSGTTFAWTVTQSSGITGYSDGSGSSIVQTLTNSGTTAGTATYTITPSYTNGEITCVGTSTDVVITVTLTNGSTCITGSECCSGYCYVDDDLDHYSPSSGGTKKCKADIQLSGTDCNDASASVYPGGYGGSLCTTCQSNGTITYQTSAQDIANECSTSDCGSGNCIGGAAACGYTNTGEGNCPACQSCVGTTSTSCVNSYGDLTTDNTGPNFCNATHYRCNGAGGCYTPCNVTCVICAVPGDCNNSHSCQDHCAEHGYLYSPNCTYWSSDCSGTCYGGSYGPSCGCFSYIY